MRRPQSRNRIQVSTNINSYWPDGCLVSQAYTNRITVILNEPTKINRLVYVSTIIKNHAAQALFYRDREASLRIENKELLSTSGNGYFCRTSCGVVFSSTQ